MLGPENTPKEAWSILGGRVEPTDVVEDNTSEASFNISPRTEVVWGGIPISCSLCYNNAQTDQFNNPIGYYYAVNIIETTETMDGYTISDLPREFSLGGFNVVVQIDLIF